MRIIKGFDGQLFSSVGNDAHPAMLIDQPPFKSRFPNGEDKTVIKLSYLYNGNPLLIRRTASL